MVDVESFKIRQTAGSLACADEALRWFNKLLHISASLECCELQMVLHKSYAS